MKKLLLYLIISTLLGFISCEDYLDLTSPNNLNSDNFYYEEDHAVQAITSAYAPFIHELAFGCKYHFWFAALSDRGLHENQKWSTGAYSANDPEVADNYVLFNRGVYRSNLALEVIPGIEMDEDLKNRLLAEAHFLRAYYHFLLTIIYNEPPLLMKREPDFNKAVPNGKKEDFYNAIKSDLRFAIDILPETYEPQDVGRATKGAALALLGKTYLYQSSHLPDKPGWDSAKYYLNEVKKMADEKGIYGLIQPIGNDSLDYVYAYMCNFTPDDLVSPSGTYPSENNKESVFELQYSVHGWGQWEPGYQSNGSFLAEYFGPFGYKNLAPTRVFAKDVFEKPSGHPAGLYYDPRRSATIFAPGDTIHWSSVALQYRQGSDAAPVLWSAISHTNTSITQGYGWKKYFEPAHYGQWEYFGDPNNVRLIRYSDVLLMLCEAEYHLNGASELALDCINQVRQRVGLNSLTSGELTKEAIIHERDVEFGFECLRFHDLVRWSMLPEPWININDYLPWFIKDKHEYLPIPVREINIMNGELKQNPGW
jgi:hypothetical protein